MAVSGQEENGFTFEDAVKTRVISDTVTFNNEVIKLACYRVSAKRISTFSKKTRYLLTLNIKAD